MPKRDSHLQFERWAKEYGPIYSLILGTKTLIVLSSDEAVKELLDRRSAIYSDRQDMYIGQTLCSRDLRLLMLKYGPTWRMMRTVCHKVLNVNAAKSYVPYQDLENKQMLFEILEQPDDFLQHIRRHTNSLTTQMTFGKRTTSHKDPNMQALFESLEEFLVLNQTGLAALIDFFPILRLLPEWLSPIKKRANAVFAKQNKLFLRHWLDAKNAIKAGTAQPSFCVDLAKQQETSAFSDDLASYTAGSLLEAGTDTTASTVYAFIQALLLHPSVQSRAQQELDTVIGTSRLPDMPDEPNLPYLRACVKESLRWMPTAILGAVPHAAVREDFYAGYRIPKGCGVLNNVWTIHNDPERYPEPRTFSPERFLGDTLSAADSAAQREAGKRDHFTFGAGRRICQGMHVAERTLFLALSRFVWAFEVAAPRDGEGRAVLPDPDRLTQGFVAMPEAFGAVVRPRSVERAEAVKGFWHEVQEKLDPETLQWRNEALPVGMGAMVGGAG